MSLSATLSNALSGLSAAQRALSVTANNVANANTEGYSRKLVNQSTQVVDGQSLGVQTGEPTRVVDQFLTTELRRQESGLGRNTVVAEAFQRIESGILGSPGEQDRGLAAQLSRLSAELEQLANDPESRPLRTAVLGSVTDMLGQISSNSATVQQLRGDADRRIGQTVQSINGDLAELHTLNNEIARSGGSADLEDRRDLILNQLAQADRRLDLPPRRRPRRRLHQRRQGAARAVAERAPLHAGRHRQRHGTLCADRDLHRQRDRPGQRHAPAGRRRRDPGHRRLSCRDHARAAGAGADRHDRLAAQRRQPAGPARGARSHPAQPRRPARRGGPAAATCAQPCPQQRHALPAADRCRGQPPGLHRLSRGTRRSRRCRLARRAGERRQRRRRHHGDHRRCREPGRHCGAGRYRPRRARHGPARPDDRCPDDHLGQRSDRRALSHGLGGRRQPNHGDRRCRAHAGITASRIISA